MKRALLLVRRNATVTPFTVQTLRSKGFEPFVFSTLPDDGGAQFRQMCAELEVDCAVSAGITITLAEVAAVIAKLQDCSFCFSLADSQRELMAEANKLIGTPDVDPAALREAVDKHTMRTKLVQHGLSRLRSLRLADAGTRSVLEAGEPFVVKPRRGANSLCVAVVRSWAEAAVMQDAFDEGAGDGDMLAEFFAADNELIAESFFEGRELSVELIRRGGQNLIVVDHEKTVLEFDKGTVLERGMASPVVGITPSQLAAAHRLAGEALDALGLSDGCYHVELRVNDADEAEIVEVNPRIGGALIWQSINAQYERSFTEDWIDLLAGREIAPLAERRCGTYQQLAHAERGLPIMTVDFNGKLPEPTVCSIAATPGERVMPYREHFTASAMWTTELASHGERVAGLMAEEYFGFRYLPGPSGRPVVLVLQPPDYEVLKTAAAMEDMDVVVVTDGPVAVVPEYFEICERVAAIVRVPSWSDLDECLSLIRETCAGSPISAVLAPQDVTREAAERITVDAGLASPVAVGG